MINTDSVVMLRNGFVTVEKLNPNQYVMGYGKKFTWLDYLDYSMHKPILLITRHYNIMVSADQRLFSDFHTPIRAGELELYAPVLTTNGLENVLAKVEMKNLVEMADLYTKSGIYVANGFVMVN